MFNTKMVTMKTLILKLIETVSEIMVIMSTFYTAYVMKAVKYRHSTF